MIWTTGVVEFYRWRQQRKALAAQAAKLVAETEAFLLQVRAVTPPTEPPHFA